MAMQSDRWRSVIGYLFHGRLKTSTRVVDFLHLNPVRTEVSATARVVNPEVEPENWTGGIVKPKPENDPKHVKEKPT